MNYPGGKGKCYQRLINLMPPHDVYIESHLGGGAVLRHKRPAARSIGIDADAQVIERWRSIQDVDCEFVCGDAVEFLSSFSFSGKELIYADPPYPLTTRRCQRIYRKEYDIDQHVALLELLVRAPCKVLVSSYDNALYRDVLGSWRRTAFLAKTHAGVREEHVWMNFDPPAKLHDSSHLGHTFRERQAVRRRYARTLEKFARMPDVERHHLLDALNRTFGDTTGSQT